MISFVYWNQEVSSYKVTCINIVTLTGTLIGQAIFGFLADKKGRKTMYGIELLLLIGSTLGVVMSSEGHNGSMSVFGWLIWWRLMVGIGVGADYPVSIRIDEVLVRSTGANMVLALRDNLRRVRAYSSSRPNDGVCLLLATARTNHGQPHLINRCRHISQVECELG
jgi:hypothetical protein